eukprot:CAMPEP_0176500072 /NCGR_PEP_ID=MMETSP0200_2-20121128/13310_1 /TAXON_ID=947934 /ORGANISM="Chaetoceros sp., Strain GSL56" /LENGTH=1051 /DNA_ID=CAMNT_0017898623 /DNA_START=829 /DNA_END=3984 /DNA_ORIENTATION=+
MRNDLNQQQCSLAGATHTDVLVQLAEDENGDSLMSGSRKDSFAAICFPFLLDDDDVNTHYQKMDVNASSRDSPQLVPSLVNDTGSTEITRSSSSHNYDARSLAFSQKKKGISTETIKQKDRCHFPSYIPSYKKSKLLSNSFATDSISNFESQDEEPQGTSQASDAMMMNLLLHGDDGEDALHADRDYSGYYHEISPRDYSLYRHQEAKRQYSSSSSTVSCSSFHVNENKNAGMLEFFSIMSGTVGSSSSNGRRSGNSYYCKGYPTASPVPSLASSEYSMSSPYTFPVEDDLMSTPKNVSSSSPRETSSPIIFMNAATRQEEQVNAAGTHNCYEGTPNSSFTCDAYYFTPAVQPPLTQYDENRNSFREEYYDAYSSLSFVSRGHEGLPQCTMEDSTRGKHEITPNVSPSAASFVGTVNYAYLPCNSYRSTAAIQGCEVSKNVANASASKTAVVSNHLSPVSHRVKPPSNENVQAPSPSLSPLPQNLKGDPLRQAKVKTELCLFYSRGKPCPFGTKCNYAHGEDELKYTRLVEMDRAGLVADIKAYRAYPCFSWVSTGACPFGLRCSNIHDPRTAGSQPSWLPHCDIPVSNLSTELVVDKSHHRNMNIISQKNPIVQNLLWNERPSLKKNNGNEANHGVANKDDAEWRDTYSLICNLANLNPNKEPKMNIVAKTKISELQRLCIVVDMSYDSVQSTDFLYKPKHLVYNELCMVLRTKYYCLLNPQDISGTFNINDCPPIHRFVKEISKQEYATAKALYNDDAVYKNDQVIIVQELAFGCVGEQSSRVSLWYDLPEITELSPQEVKRLKRNKQRNKGSNAEGSNNVTCYPGYERTFSNVWSERSYSMRIRTATSFDTHPHKPFFRVEPITKCSDVVDLVRNVLHHRISVLIQREYRAYSPNENIVKEIIISQDVQLEKMFQNIKKDVEMWQWPVSKGREIITEDTKVPKTLTEYTPASTSQVTPIWDGFLSLFELQGNDSTTSSCHQSPDSTLPVFRKLANSEKVSRSKIMPHITYHTKNAAENDFMESLFSEWNQISAHYLDGKNLLPSLARA